MEDGGWEGDGGARGKGKRSWFGNGAQEPRLELDLVGQGWGQLWLETVQGTHPGHSETLAFIPAVLGRERHRACWGMGDGGRATAAHQPLSLGWTPPNTIQFPGRLLGCH